MEALPPVPWRKKNFGLRRAEPAGTVRSQAEAGNEYNDTSIQLYLDHVFNRNNGGGLRLRRVACVRLRYRPRLCRSSLCLFAVEDLLDLLGFERLLGVDSGVELAKASLNGLTSKAVGQVDVGGYFSGSEDSRCSPPSYLHRLVAIAANLQCEAIQLLSKRH